MAPRILVRNVKLGHLQIICASSSLTFQSFTSALAQLTLEEGCTSLGYMLWFLVVLRLKRLFFEVQLVMQCYMFLKLLKSCYHRFCRAQSHWLWIRLRLSLNSLYGSQEPKFDSLLWLHWQQDLPYGASMRYSVASSGHKRLVSSDWGQWLLCWLRQVHRKLLRIYFLPIIVALLDSLQSLQI